MNSFDYFNQYVKSKIPAEFSFKYLNEKNGQFGDLQRVEFESPTKIGGVDFWSTGWLNIHLVDTSKGDELLNALLDPEEAEKAKKNAFQQLLNFLLRE